MVDRQVAAAMIWIVFVLAILITIGVHPGLTLVELGGLQALP
jgi:hypothetical protein